MYRYFFPLTTFYSLPTGSSNSWFFDSILISLVWRKEQWSYIGNHEPPHTAHRMMDTVCNFWTTQNLFAVLNFFVNVSIFLRFSFRRWVSVLGSWYVMSKVIRCWNKPSPLFVDAKKVSSRQAKLISNISMLDSLLVPFRKDCVCWTIYRSSSASCISNTA